MKPRGFIQPFLKYFKLMPERAGFTLIELLITIIILGILAMLIYPNFQGMIITAKLKEAPVAVEVIAAAEKAYYFKTGAYYGFSADGTMGYGYQNHSYSDAENALNIIIPKGNNVFCEYRVFACDYGGSDGWYALVEVVPKDYSSWLYQYYIRNIYYGGIYEGKTFKEPTHPYSKYIKTDFPSP